jgi:DNA-binding response OmpR family regulator
MKILIAEDESEIWRSYKVALETRGHNVVISEDGEECLRKYHAVKIAFGVER